MNEICTGKKRDYVTVMWISLENLGMETYVMEMRWKKQ
jgi:hypothetical protein